MSVHHASCPLCGLDLESWAVQDFHFQADHLRDDQPCEICGEWDEVRTVFTEFGWAHDSCACRLYFERCFGWSA